MELITIAEFCRKYRICPRTVWSCARTGRLRALRDKGGRIFRLIDPQWRLLDESTDPDLVMRFSTLKPGEVALLLTVHPATVRKMVRQGRLKPVYAGSQRRFSLAEVRRALAERALGRKPRSPKEVSAGVIQWARWKPSSSPANPDVLHSTRHALTTALPTVKHKFRFGRVGAATWRISRLSMANQRSWVGRIQEYCQRQVHWLLAQPCTDVKR